jgi:hypothetical protein
MIEVLFWHLTVKHMFASISSPENRSGAISFELRCFLQPLENRQCEFDKAQIDLLQCQFFIPIRGDIA